LIRLRRLSAAAFLLASLTACEAGSSCSDGPVTLPDSGPGAVVAKFECARCHDAQETLPNLPRKRDCSGCHQALHAGAFDWTYREDVVREWKAHVTHLVDVPNLTDIDGRFRRDWLIDFLQEPHDVRPGLEAMMPRFRITEDEAKAIADYFIPETESYPSVDLFGVDLEAGRRVLASNGCGNCHQMSGVSDLPSSDIPVELSSESLAEATEMAPDLRYTRRRMTPAAVVAWLDDPHRLQRESLMPDIPLSTQKRRQAAAYIMRADLADKSRPSVPEVPEPLDRKVRYREVEQKVFKYVCWHCHSDPAGNFGDGGPGNTGGFGFEGAGLDLGSPRGIKRGRIGEDQIKEQFVDAIMDTVNVIKLKNKHY
jgi:cytochrome c553